MYKIFPLSLILRLDAIFTLAKHVQLKIMLIPLFKTKCYQILVSKPFPCIQLMKDVSRFPDSRIELFFQSIFQEGASRVFKLAQGHSNKYG